MKATGAEIVIKLLEQQGIKVITGIPGSANLPLYQALSESSIGHVLARHEQGAGFIAQGMARSTGGVAVVFATSGPGATNLLTAIADARSDSVPLVAITGQVNLAKMGSDAFQEVDTYGMTIPITKHTFLVKNAADLFLIIPQAFNIASQGRPGPVVIDIPRDIQVQEVVFDLWPRDDNKALRDKQGGIDEKYLNKIADKINDSKQPVIMAGGGVIISGSSQLLRTISASASIPVSTTLMGLGIMDNNDPLNIGMPGMHGSPAANNILKEADMLIALGIRFDDRAICKAEEFCPNALIIHVDIDRAELGKIRKPHYEINGDLALFMEKVIPLLEKNKRNKWIDRVLFLKEKFPMWYNDCEDPLHPVSIIRKTGELAPDDAIITTDVGQHQMWTAQWYPFSSPRTFLTSGGLGTMGFGLPAAIGAAIANRNKTVICFSGDGSILMNIQELATLADLRLNVKIILLNNSCLGLVRQQQEMFFNENYFASQFISNPDFTSLAMCFGIKGHRLTDDNPADDLKKILADEGPALIEVPVNPAYNVLPIVPPGSAHYTMIGGEADDSYRIDSK